jgi:serine phosphatase RsbU (regulator of sigma subunit)
VFPEQHSPSPHNVNHIKDRYSCAFASYLENSSEEGLHAAYEIGRAAVAQNLSMLDLTVIHHRVLTAALTTKTSSAVDKVIDAAADFLLQALSAFEMVQRGFREAQEMILVEKRHAEQERHVAETLQRGLLPKRLPELSGIVAAARYLPGAAGLNVGGDWFDAVALPHERTAIAVGDVVGRGVRAASVMGQMRTAFRAYALDDPAPEAVVTRLNQLIPTLDPEHFSTMVYLLWTPRSRVARVVSAGHPPPLLLEPKGRTEYLELSPSLPLGVLHDTEYRQSEATLAPGSMLVLYTDGLVEQQGLDYGLAHLKQAVLHETKDLEALCDHVLRFMLPAQTVDDAALLVLRFL